MLDACNLFVICAVHQSTLPKNGDTLGMESMIDDDIRRASFESTDSSQEL